MTSRTRPVLAGLVLAGAGILAAGCGGSSAAATRHGPKVTVQARAVSGVGRVLVTAQGYALYMFQPDNQRSVTCTGACAVEPRYGVTVYAVMGLPLGFGAVQLTNAWPEAGLAVTPVGAAGATDASGVTALDAADWVPEPLALTAWTLKV